jgi:predicted deacylase
MCAVERPFPPLPALSDEHRMLLRMRDTLYEGSWDDFTADLHARAEGRPHVFVTIETSDHMRSTIGRHLALIDEMNRWEREAGKRLSADLT